MAVGRMEEALLQLPDEQSKQEALTQLLRNRCWKCLDYDASGQFWCCYESRDD